MAIDILEHGTNESGRLLPMEIAHHALFTAREKLDLLQRLKAEVTAERANPDALGFDPDEIDQAIAEVKLGVETGEGAGTAPRDGS